MHKHLSFPVKGLAAVFLILTFFTTSFFNAHAGELEDLRNEIEKRERLIQELRDRAKEYEQAISEKQGEASTLELRIVSFNQEIQNLELGISLDEQNIASLGLKITKTELQIEAHKEAIIKNKERIAALVREIYANDSTEILELILQYESFSDFSNYVYYRDAIQQGLASELDELQTFKLTLEDDVVELENNKKELEENTQTLTARRTILANQRASREQLLRDTRNQEARYQNLLIGVEERQAEAMREVFELEDQLRRTIDPSLLPQAFPGVLQWPTEGIFTQGYGCIETRFASNSYPSCNNGRGGFHNGVDIAASLGTPVRAAKKGIVVASENSPYAYGKWIAIEHDNGLVTLYTHLSVKAVSVGQTIDGGEVVGYMGNTGYSTGSHLHFVVYAPQTFTTKPSKLAGILPIGATLNPFNYLP